MFMFRLSSPRKRSGVNTTTDMPPGLCSRQRFVGVRIFVLGGVLQEFPCGRGTGQIGVAGRWLAPLARRRTLRVSP
jgi:hypothetical protein